MKAVNIPFKAKHVWQDGKKDVWDGAVIAVAQHDAHIEFTVKSRGSMFNVIAGICSNGNFMMIPTYGIGIDLSDPTDLFFNLEKIAQVSGENGPCNVMDGVTAVHGLKALAIAGYYISEETSNDSQSMAVAPERVRDIPTLIGEMNKLAYLVNSDARTNLFVFVLFSGDMNSISIEIGELKGKSVQKLINHWILVVEQEWQRKKPIEHLIEICDLLQHILDHGALPLGK